MASIATGFNKRGHKALYEGDYASAVECFYRAYITEPENSGYIMDLIYALNQNADYIGALKYCYALLGQRNDVKLDLLYFLTAEAFGGIACIEGCAQMLERSLKADPNGADSQEAIAFLDDLKQKYTIGEYDTSTNEVSLGLVNGLTEAPFLNAESYECAIKVTDFARNGDLDAGKTALEKEFEQGNFTVSLLLLGMVLGFEMQDFEYAMLCAERFKFVDDYTLTEIRSLAYHLSELDDDGIAYTVYRELYGKESGERDIAFGFAVSCAKMGDLQHAASILSEIASANGGIGPATQAVDIVDHSYIYRFEGDKEKEIREKIKNGACKSRTELAEMLCFVRSVDPLTAAKLFELLDADDAFCETELRCFAMEPETTLFTRAEAARRLRACGKENIYFNTGTDIVLFSMQIETTIAKYMNNEYKGQVQ